jgi:DNA polymerase III subunit gamma/tau
LLYSKALFCEVPEDGEPCGTCDRCKEFGDTGRGVIDFHRFECGERSTVEEIKGFIDIARTAPWIGKRRVLLLDESHVLSPRSHGALLRIVEFPPPWSTFILVTSKLSMIPTALRSRLTHLELGVLSSEAATNFVTTICRAENLACDPSGLALLQAAVGGHPRDLLRAIEKVAEFGTINETNVRLALNLNFLDRLTTYSHALLSGKLQCQLDLMEEWADMPSRKLGFLHQFFVFNYFVGVRHLNRDDPIMRGLSSEFRATLLDGMAARACRLNLQETEFWDNAIAALAPRERLSEHAFAMVLSNFDRLVNRLPDRSDSHNIDRSETGKLSTLARGQAVLGGGFIPASALRRAAESASHDPPWRIGNSGPHGWGRPDIQPHA